ncbi:DUF59 domain-containing protein [Nakamurella antarctica]|uniref:Iron-sulfur cluster carrier protein n=1 Tax=Nakamurella antarctica TaxID=1902245 RepID=A0A3G8ZLI2_9ACTN|nr:P-loop NTPase [Nakamurella antarctica]AZI58123.1 DUF59 domain-containing protein [Nakamurella antarctica]
MSLTPEIIRKALDAVKDPEIRRPITDLGMVDKIDIAANGHVSLVVLITIAGCPMKDTITRDVTAAVEAIPGVSGVSLALVPMNDEQRQALRDGLKGGATKDIPFARAESRTRVYAIASGKGGVGKSTVTVNLAASLAAQGLSVGILDADVYGFSIPRMMGVTTRPTRISDMILPPVCHGVKIISVGMFVEGNAAVVWRGPMLHRALQQFLADVFWGDLDVLLLDLPPGTGDVAISTAQLIPSTEILVVTTPQTAAAEVAERAGAIALQTRQKVIGVVENMSGLVLPDGGILDVFGTGGGQIVSDSLTRSMGAPVPLLGRIPLEIDLREAGDAGVPLVLSHPESASAKALSSIAASLAARSRPLVGISLGLSPASRT